MVTLLTEAEFAAAINDLANSTSTTIAAQAARDIKADAGL